MNAWLPQASYPCGNFSGISSLKFWETKGSIGHTFMVCIHTENQNQNQGDLYPFVLLEISVLNESPLGHLHYLLTDVLPLPNFPPDNIFNLDWPIKRPWSQKMELLIPAPPHWISKKTIKIVVFQWHQSSHLFYTLYVFLQCQTRVKLNRVFFPHWFCQAHSLGCSFTR